MTWAVGDLAVCVDASERLYNGVPSVADDVLQERRIYHVTAVTVRTWHGAVLTALRLDEFAYHSGFDAERFRKVVRDKHEACEEEFITLLNRSKAPIHPEIVGK